MPRAVTWMAFAVLAAIALTAGTASLLSNRPGFDPLGPDRLPVLISAICLALLAAIVIRGLGEGGEPAPGGASKAAVVRAGMLFGLATLLVLLLGLGTIPFRFLAIGFLVVAMLVLSQGVRSPRLVGTLVLTAALLSFGVDFVFRGYLSVNLP